MAEYVIERYDTFKTKVCPYELLFGDFFDQPIPPDWYEFPKDNDDNNNDTTGTPVDNFSQDK